MASTSPIEDQALKIMTDEQTVCSSSHTGVEEIEEYPSLKVADEQSLCSSGSTIVEGSRDLSLEEDKQSAGNFVTTKEGHEDFPQPDCSTSSAIATDQANNPYKRKVIFKIGDSSSSKSNASPDSILQLIKKAEETSSLANEAAFDCRKILNYKEKCIDMAKRLAQSARWKAQTARYLPNATHYKAIAGRFYAAAKLTSKRANEVTDVMMPAVLAGNLAKSLAQEMRYALEKNELNNCEKVGFLEWAEENANHRTAVAKKVCCLMLKAMKKCCKSGSSELPMQENFSDSDDSASPLVGRDKPATNDGWFTLIITVFVGVLGCVMFSMAALLNSEKYPLVAMRSVGVLSAIWVLGYIIYKFRKSVIRKRKLAVIKKRNTILQFIDNLLSKIEEYIAENNLTPIPSDEENYCVDTSAK